MIKIKKFTHFQPYFVAHFEYQTANEMKTKNGRIELSLTNPYINRLSLLLESSVFFNERLSIELFESLEFNKFITEDDKTFLLNIFYPEASKDVENPHYDKFFVQFHRGLRETWNHEKHFFKRIRLCYIDEGGLSHDTEIFPDDPSIENQIIFE